VGAVSVFTDSGGQDWAVYEAVDRNDPYFTGTGTTKRPALLDPLDWVKGWPTIRGGAWASDTPVQGPAALPGQKTAYTMPVVKDPALGAKIKSLSDDFTGKKLSRQWSWVRKPAGNKAYLKGKMLNFVGCDCDLYKDANNAPVLTEKTPSGNYIVQVRIKPGFPTAGCCYNYIQPGVVIYQDDDNYIKLAPVSIWDTRQTLFAKETTIEPRYAEMYVGPPGSWTYLRIYKTNIGSEELYRAYTSTNGKTWYRGGVWTATFGASAKIGLVSQGGAALNKFKYVHVYKVK
jgi:arabinan endo-1,5-alpha-L-arabinosidase